MSILLYAYVDRTDALSVYSKMNPGDVTDADSVHGQQNAKRLIAGVVRSNEAAWAISSHHALPTVAAPSLFFRVFSTHSAVRRRIRSANQDPI